jgi:hypothetical protein
MKLRWEIVGTLAIFAAVSVAAATETTASDSVFFPTRLSRPVPVVAPSESSFHAPTLRLSPPLSRQFEVAEQRPSTPSEPDLPQPTAAPSSAIEISRREPPAALLAKPSSVFETGTKTDFPKSRMEFEQRFGLWERYDNLIQQRVSETFYTTNDLIFVFYGGFLEWRDRLDTTVNQALFRYAAPLTDELGGSAGAFWGAPRFKTEMDTSRAGFRIVVPFGK